MTRTAAPRPRRRNAPRMAALVSCALLVAGCKTDIWLGNNQLMWLWAVAPFFVFILTSWLWVQAARGKALNGWRLEDDPMDPGAGSALWWLGAIVIGLLIAFVLVNVLGEFATRQKAINVALWATASLIGALLGTTLGLRLADRSYAGRYGDPK